MGSSAADLAAVGMLLLTMRLLNWLRHWSESFAKFVATLVMILFDLGPFLVVLAIALVCVAQRPACLSN